MQNREITLSPVFTRDISINISIGITTLMSMWRWAGISISKDIRINNFFSYASTSAYGCSFLLEIESYASTYTEWNDVNCGNTNEMKMWPLQLNRNLSNCEVAESSSFLGLQRDSNLWPLQLRCSALPAELWRPIHWQVSVVLKRTVGDSDWHFDNLNGSHLQSQSDIVSSVDGIYVSGYWPDWSIKLSCYWL